MQLLCLVIVVAAAASVADGSAWTADGKVHDLSSGSFEKAVRSNQLSFVEFFAPWCGHCKKLVPEWERTAELSADLGVLVAKVDATAEKSLAQEQEVQSFPTLKLYRGSPKVSKNYNGARTADKMAEWVKVWHDAQLVERLGSAPTASSIKSWASAKPFAIVGFLSGSEAADASLRQVLEDLSFALNPQSPGGEVPVGEVVADEALVAELGGDSKLPCVVVIRDFDYEEKVLFYQPTGKGGWKGGYDSLLKWVKEKRVPALIPAKEDTQQFFLHDIDPKNGLVMYFGDEQVLRQGMHGLAVKFLKTEKRLKWVHASPNDFSENLAKSVSLTKTDFPEVVLWEFGETEDDDKVYRLSQQPAGAAGLTASALEDFVKSWQADELDAEKDPVQSVTSESFQEVVLDSNKDVLVEFYAPWCGQCKALAPEYKQLAAHYASDSGVTIVKMDSTKHKLDSVEVKSYPTLKLFLKGKKDAPVDLGFKAGRDKKSLVDFIEEHRAGGKGGSKKEEKEKKSKDKKSQKKEKVGKKEYEPWGYYCGCRPSYFLLCNAHTWFYAS
ncbi:unnamed protein product [Polarella glacialis]|uniref:Thioredoxin domain-containing protein n=1 Tax=Polarella glacialis TaxID=89957 RepID=A0A813K384_POLGL|nr:unnamed protein product [Polarella glacialis]